MNGQMTPFTIFAGNLKQIPVSRLKSLDNEDIVHSSIPVVLDVIPVEEGSTTTPGQVLISKKRRTESKRFFDSVQVRRSRRAKFPGKLYNLVSNTESGSIVWSPSGLSFQVNYSRFEQEYLDPTIKRADTGFKSNNLASFVRQLNLYGFKKIRLTTPDKISVFDVKKGGGDLHEFSHPYFLRDQPEKVKSIVRQMRRSTKTKSHGEKRRQEVPELTGSPEEVENALFYLEKVTSSLGMVKPKEEETIVVDFPSDGHTPEIDIIIEDYQLPHETIHEEAIQDEQGDQDDLDFLMNLPHNELETDDEDD